MNLYVSNLDFTVKEEDLKKLFGAHGTVGNVKVITDHHTGYSRGFAFVDMPNDGEAQKAMETINGHEMNNRAIAVVEARPKEAKSKSSFYPEKEGFKRI